MVSPVLEFDAKARLKKLKKRRDWWQNDVIKPLTTSSSLAPSAMYQYRLDHFVALKTKIKLHLHARAARYLGRFNAHYEHKTAEKLTKKNLPAQTDLVVLRADHAKADTDVRAIQGRMHTFATPPLAGDARFFKKIHAALAKGDHVKASAIIQSKKPPILKGLLMSKAEKAAYTSQLTVLLGKVNDHQSATERRKTAKQAKDIVEWETAKAIAKLLRKDDASSNLKDTYHRILRKAGRATIDPANPRVAALVAGGDRSMALLVKYAGKHPTAKDIRNELASGSSGFNTVSFESMRQSLHDLAEAHKLDYIQAKKDEKLATQKFHDCRRFINNCQHAMKHELSAARGGIQLGRISPTIRHDLIEEIEAAIQPGSTVTDAEIKELFDKMDEREKHWASPANKTDIEFDRDLLKVTTTFDRTKMHPVAMPEFNMASRVAEHLNETWKNVQSFAARHGIPVP